LLRSGDPPAGRYSFELIFGVALDMSPPRVHPNSTAALPAARGYPGSTVGSTARPGRARAGAGPGLGNRAAVSGGHSAAGGAVTCARGPGRWSVACARPAWRPARRPTGSAVSCSRHWSTRTKPVCVKGVFEGASKQPVGGRRSVVVGSGSGLSEEPASGCKAGHAGLRVVPVALPGSLELTGERQRPGAGRRSLRAGV
jgi:hypothetical protein